FQELSVQVGLTKRELAEVEAKLQATVREQKRGVLTRGELDKVEDGVGMYQSIGKMFLAQSKEEITALLNERQDDKSKSETQLQAKQSYLQNRLTSEQGNLKKSSRTYKRRAN
ncbi:unnamed protein product, partial [Laminaria digitata]